MTLLTDVFDFMYSLIKDTDLAKIPNEDLYQLTKRWFQMASARFKECKKDLTIIEDEEGNYCTTEELTAEEMLILSHGMVLYWLETKVNYNKLMKNTINTKDYNQLSNANLLLRMSELLDYYRQEFFRLRKAYSKRYNKDWNGWA